MRLAPLGLAAAAVFAAILPLFAETPASNRIERRLKKALEDGQQRAESELGADLDSVLRPGSTLAAIRNAITFDACRSDIFFLASDELEGRDTGSAGHRKAAQWAADRFAEAGLKPVGDDETYFQAWKFGKKPTMNVVAYLEGKTDELVVVGAHLDHVGKGPSGGARRAHPFAGSDDIYNGADDNASGSTTVVEMACALAKLKAKPKRGILFILFSGEEKGLFGSMYYVTHPIFPLKDTIAMINYDMVGRNADHECDVFGEDGSPELGDAVRHANEAIGMTLHFSQKSPGIYAQSDQWSFHPKNVPSIFFTSGMHTEYHTALDSADLINVGKLEEVAELGAELALDVANLKDRPSWHKIDLGPRLGVGMAPSPSAKKRAKLGIAEDEGAVTLASVTPNYPAARAGLLAGDIIVAIDGKKIPVDESDEAFREMIYASDKQVFTVIRDGKRFEVKVDYAAPKEDEEPAPEKPPKKKNPK